MEILKQINSNKSGYYSRESATKICFGESVKIGQQKATADTHDGCAVAFWKEQWVDKSGNIKAGSPFTNWKNSLSDDKKIIISYLNDGEPKTNEGTQPDLFEYSSPLHVFWNDDHHEHTYRFVGSYMLDFNASQKRKLIFRKLRDDINLKPWHDNPDGFQYIDHNKVGYDVFEKIYIGGDFKKQKKKVNEFVSQYYDGIDPIETSINDVSAYICELQLNPSTFGDYVDNLRRLLGPQNISNDINIEDLGAVCVSIASLKGDDDNNHNLLIRESILGQELTGKLLSLYYPRYFLYSLSSDETDYYLNKLGFIADRNDDITEKHCLLYFWKQCNYDMNDWSSFKFYRFLQFVFGEYSESQSQKTQEDTGKPKEAHIVNGGNNSLVNMASDNPTNELFNMDRKTIIVVSEKDVKASEETERSYQEEIHDYSEEPDTLNDCSITPEEKDNSFESNSNSEIKSYPRDQKKRKLALIRSEYTCELDSNHSTFISKVTNKPYLETHHLIPLEYYESFDYSLDNIANIVCLCSNCHNEIHYGKHANVLVEQLYEKRKAELDQAKIGIELDQLLKMYNGEYIKKY